MAGTALATGGIEGPALKKIVYLVKFLKSKIVHDCLSGRKCSETLSSCCLEDENSIIKKEKQLPACSLPSSVDLKTLIGTKVLY